MKPALIDTDILSYFLKGNPVVVSKFQEYLNEFDSINISIITFYEVLSGPTFKNASNQIKIFENFCKNANIINLSEDSIKRSAEIYSYQRLTGKAIDDIDILIAGIALSNNMTIFTNNSRHFGKIKELNIENWSS